MTEHFCKQFVSFSEPAPDADARNGLFALPQRLPSAIDRSLGYFGQQRLVFFYYEPRGEEVVWNDGRTYGFGTGGWLSFINHVAPLAEQYGLNVGRDGHPAEHALVLDRLRGEAYFANRASAEALLARQRPSA